MTPKFMKGKNNIKSELNDKLIIFKRKKPEGLKIKQKILSAGQTPRLGSIETLEEEHIMISKSDEYEENSIMEEQISMDSLFSGDIQVQMCPVDFKEELEESSDKRIDCTDIEEQLGEFVDSDNHFASRKPNFNFSGKIERRPRTQYFTGVYSESNFNKDSVSVGSILKNGKRKIKVGINVNSCCLKENGSNKDKGVRFHDVNTVYYI